MDFVQQGRDLLKKQLKQEVEQEQKVCLESLKNQTKGQQEILENNTSELSLLCEQERNKKRSIEQLDQQIRIKTKNIAELGRQEVVKKQQLGEVMQKIESQKRMLVVLESQAQKASETWKNNFENLEQNWNCRVAEINAEEERRLKKVEDKERTLRIEIAQKETVEREITRKEFELEMEKVKKSIAEGYSKLKKIHKQTKLVQNYLQQIVPMSANHQSPPINPDQPNLPDSPVDVEQCVPLQPPPQPFIPNQSIHSELFPQLPLSALPAQPSVICYAPSTSKLAPTVTPVTLFSPKTVTLSTTTTSPISTKNSRSEKSTTYSKVNTIKATLFIPEVFTSAKSSATTSLPISTVASKSLISTFKLIPSATSTLPKFSSPISQPISTATSNLDKSTTTSKLVSFATSTFLKSSATTSSPISTVASTSAKFVTTTSKFASYPTSTFAFANSSKLIPSNTTLNLSNLSPPLSPVTSTLADSSISTSPSFSANLDKSLNLDNGIEIVTIDDSDGDVEEELTGLDNNNEDNETSKSIIQIQKNFSTLDELIDVNPIGGNDIAPVGTTAAAVKPMDNFENEPTESTDNVIDRLIPETSIQNLNLGNDSESVDDQFELVGGQNDNQHQKLTSKSNNRQQIKAQRRGCREYYKLRNNKKRKESLEQCRDYYCLRKRQPTLQQNEEEPEQQQNSQTSSELNEMGQNGKLRYNTDIDNRATLKSKENGRGRKRNGGGGGIETSEQSKQSNRERRLAQKREWMKQNRANETPEQRKHRMTQKREWGKERRANETPEERERRLAQKREYHKRRAANETPEQKESRLALQKEYDKQKLANETPEQRKCRLAKHLAIQHNYINRKKQQS